MILAVEKKLAVLESEIEQLKLQSAVPHRTGKRYVENAGQFKNDAVYDEIVRRGRKDRESLRPKPRGKNKH